MTTLRSKTIRSGWFGPGVRVSDSALSSTRVLRVQRFQAQQMCTGDAFRLCSSEIPNIPKITACMFKNRSSLSAGCRAVMDRDLAAQKSSKVASE